MSLASASLASASLASSPWPTRSPEKLPRVSPPASLEGCGSTRRAEAEGLSPEALEAVEDAVEAIDSSITWPNSAFPFPPKENLPASFTAKKRKKIQCQEQVDTCRFIFVCKNFLLVFVVVVFLPCDIPAPCGTELKLVALQEKIEISNNCSFLTRIQDRRRRSF